jgi:hypothetical protein
MEGHEKPRPVAGLQGPPSLAVFGVQGVAPSGATGMARAMRLLAMPLAPSAARVGVDKPTMAKTAIVEEIFLPTILVSVDRWAELIVDASPDCHDSCMEMASI